MIMESFLNSDWLQHSFHSWAQRCQNANSAESVERLKEELVDSTLWDELTILGFQGLVSSTSLMIYLVQLLVGHRYWEKMNLS